MHIVWQDSSHGPVKAKCLNCGGIASSGNYPADRGILGVTPSYCSRCGTITMHVTFENSLHGKMSMCIGCGKLT